MHGNTSMKKIYRVINTERKCYVRYESNQLKHFLLIDPDRLVSKEYHDKHDYVFNTYLVKDILSLRYEKTPYTDTHVKNMASDCAESYFSRRYSTVTMHYLDEKV